ncbi:hypothetical protein NDU88_002458 [Pleurodeles waltl]|uniref:Uncharacterized protein n=1 Tax=Pleurodeles waltl TaxID=8319 RepID=A0AAV7SD18_PLEWA|nr:hypothetical protein NDU88_002458 [Pleurodeles waltl]
MSDTPHQLALVEERDYGVSRAVSIEEYHRPDPEFQILGTLGPVLFGTNKPSAITPGLQGKYGEEGLSSPAPHLLLPPCQMSKQCFPRNNQACPAPETIPITLRLRTAIRYGPALHVPSA